MTTCRQMSPVSMLLAFLGGCTAQQYAEMMVAPPTTNGRVRQWLLGTGEQLLQQGRIDEHLRIPVRDMTELDVWIIRDRRRRRALRDHPGQVPPTRGTAVVIHGVLDSKARFFGFAQALANRGFDVVLFDHRAHGRSEGTFITYGAKERYDVRDLVTSLTGRGAMEGPMYAFGFSMGAATALEYAAMDSRCRGVMAASPYADLEQMTARMAWWLSESRRAEVLAEAGRLAGFDPGDVSPRRAAARLEVPLLVLHGRLDHTVPYAQGKAVYAAARCPKQMITVPLAGHVSLVAGRDAWLADRFVEMTLIGGKGAENEETDNS
ncbi:MAG: alpha/beta hydrolase [Phycisphaerae bacterium]